MTMRFKQFIHCPRPAAFVSLLLVPILILLLLTAAAPAAQALEPDEIWEKFNPSIFYVESRLPSGNRDYGTGFACEINGTNHLITAFQILAGAKGIQVGHTEKNLKDASAYVGQKDKDIAALRVHADLTFPALKMRTTPLRTGERVYVIGFNVRRVKSITQGILAAQSESTLQFDAPISLGSAGSPMLDKDGLVIGVVSSAIDPVGSRGAQNMNEAVNLTSARQFLSDSIAPLAGATEKMGVITRTKVLITSPPGTASTTSKHSSKAPSGKPGKTFFEAWKELAAFEKSLVDSIRKLKVMELHQYLMSDWEIATSIDGKKDSNGRPLLTQAEQQVLLHDILSTHQNLTQAITNVNTFLSSKALEFNRLPALFENLQDDEMLRDFLKDETQSLPDKFELQPEEIVPLLRKSVVFMQSRYLDTSFQILFMGYHLNRVRSRDPKLFSQVQQLREQTPEIDLYRKQPGIHYPFGEMAKDKTGRIELSYFLQSLSIMDLRDRLEILEPDTRVQDQVDYLGGFEHDILEAFETFALEQLERGKLGIALAHIHTNAVHKAFPNHLVHAQIAACNGQINLGTILYRKSVNEGRVQLDVFDLERHYAVPSRKQVFNDLFDGPAHYLDLSPEHRSNSEKFSQYIRTLAWAKLASTTDPAGTLASAEFSAFGEFERMAIVHRLKHALKDKTKAEQKKLQNIIDRIPAAREADQLLNQE